MTVKEFRDQLKGRKPTDQLVILAMEPTDGGSINGVTRQIVGVRKASDDGRILIEVGAPTEMRRWDDWRA